MYDIQTAGGFSYVIRLIGGSFLKQSESLSSPPLIYYWIDSLCVLQEIRKRGFTTTGGSSGACILQGKLGPNLANSGGSGGGVFSETGGDEH